MKRSTAYWIIGLAMLVSIAAFFMPFVSMTSLGVRIEFLGNELLFGTPFNLEAVKSGYFQTANNKEVLVIALGAIWLNVLLLLFFIWIDSPNWCTALSGLNIVFLIIANISFPYCYIQEIERPFVKVELGYGFLLCGVGNIVALAISIFAGLKTEKRPSRNCPVEMPTETEIIGDTAVCHKCLLDYNAKSDVCPYCGAPNTARIKKEKEPVVVRDTPTEASEPVTSSKRLYIPCPSCGEMFEWDMKYCPHCGTKNKASFTTREEIKSAETGKDISQEK